MLRKLLDRLKRAAPEPKASPSAAAPAPAGPAAGDDGPILPPLEELATYDVAERPPDMAATEERLRPIAERIFDHFRDHHDDYPGFPTLAMHLFALVEKPEVDVRELTRLIGQDPLVSAQVLQVASSAFYSAGAEVASLRDAILRLGTKTIARIAAQAATRAVFDIEERAGYELFKDHWSGLWTHAMTTSLGAGWLAMRIPRSSVDRAQLGGLMHDLGKTIALRSLASLVLTGSFLRPSPAEVHQLLEATHVDLGVEMAMIWTLPEFLIRLCAEQHESGIAGDPEHQEVHLVRVVSGITEMRKNPFHRAGLDQEVLASVAALGLDRFVVRALVSEMSLFDAAVARFDTARAPTQ